MGSTTLLREAVQSIRANRMRTVLTMLGIVIGVGAVIVMVALGNGARQQIEASITAAEDAPLLNIRPDGVVLIMARRSFADDVQVEYATSAYRADRYQLWVPLAQAARPIVRKP